MEWIELYFKWSSDVIFLELVHLHNASS